MSDACDGCGRHLGRDTTIYAKRGIVCCSEKCLHKALDTHKDLIEYDDASDHNTATLLAWAFVMGLVIVAVLVVL